MLGAVLFVGLAALSAVLVFFSGVLLVPVGVQTWGEAGCFLLLWCGWVLGGLVTYSVGRHLGRPFVRRLLSAGAVARYEALIPAGGSFLTATLVQLAFPSDISGYFFGLLGYQARVYLGALVFAELPYALGTVYLGAAFLQRQYWLLRRRRWLQPPRSPGAGDVTANGPRSDKRSLLLSFTAARLFRQFRLNNLHFSTQYLCCAIK